MKNKVVYIADLDQDIDDVLAIEYLFKYDVLDYIVCDPEPNEEGKQRLNKVILKGITCYPEIQAGTKTVFCGGALTKVAKYLEHYSLDSLVIQGGFVGSNIIKEKDQLEKFKGLEFTRTFNFNMDLAATEKVLNMGPEKVKNIILVGKNVCHSEKNTIKDIWNFEFFKNLQEEYNIKETKRLHDVLMCHEGLVLLNIIPDKSFCNYQQLVPMNQNDLWGASDILSDSKRHICTTAVGWK